MLRWAGLKLNDPNVHVVKRNEWEHEDETTLTTLNDEDEYDFEQIADIIEEEL